MAVNTNGRLTSKKFLDWINEQLLENGITSHKAVEVYRTRYSTWDYEGGASKMNVRLQYIKDPDGFMSNPWFCCYYSLKEYEQEMKKGCEMVLTLKGLWTDITVDLKTTNR